MLRVGVHADELAAGKRRHLNFPARAGVGGQLGRAHILPPGLLDRHRVPYAAHPGNYRAVFYSGDIIAEAENEIRNMKNKASEDTEELLKQGREKLKDLNEKIQYYNESLKQITRTIENNLS